MAFKGPYDADSLDRAVLVLQDRHQFHLVDNTQVCIFHIIKYCFQLLCNVSHPDFRSDPIGGSEPGSGCETIYWDSLPNFFIFYFFFQSRTYTCGYGPHLITESKYYIQIKRTTTEVVSIKI